MNVIDDALETTIRDIAHYQKRAENLLWVRQQLADVDLADVDSVSTYGSDQYVQLYLNLKDEAKDSKLPHKLAQKLGMRMEKSKCYSGEALQYSGSVEIDGRKLRIDVCGVVPATCKLKQVEETLTEAEYQRELSDAMERVKRVRTRTVIECNEEVAVEE